jgi:hypothetical protein
MDVEVNSLHVKRIVIEDLVDDIYIVKVDSNQFDLKESFTEGTESMLQSVDQLSLKKEKWASYSDSLYQGVDTTIIN